MIRLEEQMMKRKNKRIELQISDNCETTCSLAFNKILLSNDIKILVHDSEEHLFAETIESIIHETLHIIICRTELSTIEALRQNIAAHEMTISEMLYQDDNSEHNKLIRCE